MTETDIFKAALIVFLATGGQQDKLRTTTVTYYHLIKLYMVNMLASCLLTTRDTKQRQHSLLGHSPACVLMNRLTAK